VERRTILLNASSALRRDPVDRCNLLCLYFGLLIPFSTRALAPVCRSLFLTPPLCSRGRGWGLFFSLLFGFGLVFSGFSGVV